MKVMPPEKLEYEPQAFRLTPKGHYRRLLILSVAAVSLVAVIPLIIMTAINHSQYQEALHVESIRPIARLTANAKLSMEYFISERLSALAFVIQSERTDQLRDSTRLERLLKNLKHSFRGFIDLGVITQDGQQVAYAGPYDLRGKSYKDQSWFQEVAVRGVHVSDVFMGHRHLPHFVVAVSHYTDSDGVLILRATIDTDEIIRRIQSWAVLPASDAFLINRDAILQTPSRRYGAVLEQFPLQMPPESRSAETLDLRDENGDPLVMGYGYIDRSPFIAILLHHPHIMQEGWLSLRRNVVLFLAISILLIFGVAATGSFYMINRARQAETKRAGLYHKMEYTNKMAAIGRLAAGVAHEINNPLAIINEKAGLLKDLLSLSKEMPPKEKLLAQINSIIMSVDRCGTITHRLLGFAKHMDVQPEEIDLGILLKAVLTFLDKEASYRNLQVTVEISDEIPTLQSDRGQLQQVFLNLVNNAFAAVEDGGSIFITITQIDEDHAAVEIVDNGMGISKENLEHIFEPFFTTKKGSGTGLGLSITYGIVQKLRGRIEVSSRLGEGTCFTVTLPFKRTAENRSVV